MTPQLPDLALGPVTIRQARRKVAMLLAVSLAFVMVGAWVTTDPHDWVTGAVTIALFGVGTVIAAIMLAQPASLVISPTGLTEQSPFRVRRWDWREVTHFRLWTYQLYRGITFDNARHKSGIARSLNLAFGTGSDFLGGQWELSKQDLVDLLNDAKARWG